MRKSGIMLALSLVLCSPMAMADVACKLSIHNNNPGDGQQQRDAACNDDSFPVATGGGIELLSPDRRWRITKSHPREDGRGWLCAVEKAFEQAPNVSFNCYAICCQGTVAQ